MTSQPLRSPAALAVTLPALLLLAACSGESDAAEPGGDLQAAADAAGLEVNTSPDQDRVRTAENPEAIALLPEEFADSDTLTRRTTTSPRSASPRTSPASPWRSGPAPIRRRSCSPGTSRTRTPGWTRC